MPRIEFTRYEQIWQTRKIVWTDADWEAFKLKLKQELEEALPNHKEYFTNLYNIVKDMSFESAIKDYNKWRNGDDDCITVGSYGVFPFGAYLHDVLSTTAAVAEPCEQSCDDSNEYIEIYED